MINKKIKKLFRNPNLYFYDYFAKRVNRFESNSTKSKNIAWFDTEAFKLDTNIHPLVHVARRFNLRTGAITGFPDQSLLVESNILFDFLAFVFKVAYTYKSGLKFYTLGGSINTEISTELLLDVKKLEYLYNKLNNKPDFVVEFNCDFSNNFAAHIFLYKFVGDDVYMLPSSKAYIKRVKTDQFNSIYPSIIDEFGNYDFGTPFQIDAVYTWVNKDDEIWQKLWNDIFPEKNLDTDRFASKDELKYSLRSLEKFAPWINRIFIVSNCSKPKWLKNHPKLIWVEHESIFPEVTMLPTFNSHAIEACLHRIEGLSEHFIYFNDDMFLNQPCYPNDFFDFMGRSVSYFEPYGMVFENNLLDPNMDYLVSSINSYRLLKSTFPIYNPSCLHKHVPYALKKSVLHDMEEKWDDEFKATRYSKLRSNTDVNITSFLYHHYAMATGKAVDKDNNYLLVRPENIKTLFEKNNFKTYKFLCFNDGNNSSNDEKYKQDFIKFCQLQLSQKSSYETEIKIGVNSVRN